MEILIKKGLILIMIEVKNLTKRYDGHIAVNDISFKIEKGEIVGFLGPNGAGKSTTMNMLTGYISSTDGSVFIDGFDILESPKEAKSKIGYLPEIPPLYIDMRITEYLNFVYELKNADCGDKKQHIEKIMNITGIMNVKNRLIKNLSKGYKQRVGLAQALIGNPEVLILDEPTVGLDPNQIVEIRNVIKQLGKEHTIILSSHILSEISAVCSRVIIINNGKIIAEDTPENLAKKYGSENKLYVRIDGDENKVNEVMSEISSIESYELSNSGTDILAEVTVKKGIDARKEIAHSLLDADLSLIELREKEVTLEDIFRKLTKRDNSVVKNILETEKAAKEEEKNESDI